MRIGFLIQPKNRGYTIEMNTKIDTPWNWSGLNSALSGFKFKFHRWDNSI